MLNIKQLLLSASVTTATTLGTLLLGVEPTNAASLVNLAIGSIDLRNGITTPLLVNNDVVSFVQPPTLGHDGYYETVLKITFDRNYVSPMAFFSFRYDADPKGMTVNIGDSITNNGYGGDGGTQSNDAELQIGNLTTPGNLASERNDMLVFGNDYSNNKNPILQVPDIVKPNAISRGTTKITVSDQVLTWENNHFPGFISRLSGSISSPYLYALGGQPDREGPINYDFFASFNRSISSSERWGTGLSEVTIAVFAESVPEQTPVGESVPEPTTVLDFCLAVGVGAFLKRRNSKKQNQA